MRFRTILTAALLLLAGFGATAQNLKGTYLFASRDTCNLFMDVYEPSAGSETVFDGHDKPTVLFVFGGGFITGKRDGAAYIPWFKMLNDNGYRVISIDYRLGLKGVNTPPGVKMVKKLQNAINMAVEDLFSATNYIIENAADLGVDPANIVVSGSSAGAITSLQAEYEISNRTALAGVLPKDFNYAGAMAFAGAILSDHGKLKYASEPCPQLLLHGTADKTVNYNQIRFLNWGFFGSRRIAERLDKFGYNYSIYRYKDHSHDIAEHFTSTFPEQIRFLEVNVMLGKYRIIDAYVDDPMVEKYEAVTLESLYN